MGGVLVLRFRTATAWVVTWVLLAAGVAAAGPAGAGDRDGPGAGGDGDRGRHRRARVTTTDGTQYFFGRHRRYAGDTAATNSVFTVPVAGNHSGEPCHVSSFADSFCSQAWRWSLDYVVDPDGNTMTYFYTREQNRYGQNLNDDSASYHRGGYLTRIEYGQRQGSEHTTPAPARVVFTVAERCLPGGETSCQPGELKEGTADDWPDVPYDAGTRTTGTGCWFRPATVATSPPPPTTCAPGCSMPRTPASG